VLKEILIEDTREVPKNDKKLSTTQLGFYNDLNSYFANYLIRKLAATAACPPIT
jgi:hypothetical protein